VSDITTRDREARFAAYASFAIQGLCFASLVTRVPQIQKAHHLSDGAVGLVLMLVPVVAGVGSVLAGLLFPRFGSALVLRVAQPLVCLSIVFVGLTGSNNLALYIATPLFGLFVGAVDAAMNAQAVTVERKYGQSMLTGFYSVWSAAGILGGLWAALANKVNMSLFVGFVIPAVLGIAASVLTGLKLFRKHEEGSAPSAEELKAAAKQVPWRPILIVGAAMCCFYIADAAVSLYGTKYMTDVVKSTTTIAPIAYVVYQIAMVVSRAIADFGVRRYGAVLVVRVGALVGLVGMLGVVLAPNWPLALIAFTIMGLGLCVVAPVSFTAAGKVDPTGLGVAVSRVNIFNYVGFVVGAVLMGAIPQLRIAFAIPAALIIVIIVLAKGFEPTPVEGAIAFSPAMERPVV
jgi:MFS family permease